MATEDFALSLMDVISGSLNLPFSLQLFYNLLISNEFVC